MSNLKGCFSSKTDDWKTPKDIFDTFMSLGYVDCFPYQSNYDETDYLYFDHKLFINPPYSKINFIRDWLLDQIRNGNKIALLIPARTDTKYFRELTLEDNVTIVFITGRLHFNDSPIGAPFPSILLLFNYDHSCFHHFLTIRNSDLCNFIKEYL